ncbi:MAG: hypothetical protein ACFFCW_36640, partial [Candidatus Hodarchaeota archaeon]
LRDNGILPVSEETLGKKCLTLSKKGRILGSQFSNSAVFGITIEAGIHRFRDNGEAKVKDLFKSWT